MSLRLRIFVSSPSDVREERLRAQLTIQKLARDYGARVQLVPYFWENEPQRATGHFQDDIEPPSTHDIVVLILWSRLGTPLPSHTELREYRGIDGRTPVTGTEWEFEDALQSFRARQTPDLLAYRRMGDPGMSLTDEALRADQARQWDGLQAFWSRHFENKGAFLAASGRYASLDEFDAKFEADLAKLIERRLRAQAAGADAESPLYLKGRPYLGLAAYDFEDAPVFFGRDGAVRTALTRLMRAAEGGTAFLLVLGASGAGKSSLARAGLLPALVAAKAVPGVGLWRRVVMRPGDAGHDPVVALARALVAGDTRAGEGLPELVGTGGNIEELARHLRAAAADPSYPFRTALRTLADTERAKRALLGHEEARLILLIDQLEELFTQPGITDADRAVFARVLAGLARSGLVWVIATMRSDLWHRTADLPDMVGLTEAGSRLDLAAPDGAELLEMVRRPARAVGLGFDEDADSGLSLDAVLAEAAAAEPGALPLLSVLLEDLYRRDVLEAGQNRLSFASYRLLGELKGAIATRAESIYRRIEEEAPDVAAVVPSLMRAVVTTSAGAAMTARPAPLADFPMGTPARSLVDAFVAPDARLLTIEERDGVAYVRLAHEALIAHWPRAARQVEADRRDIETRARLESLLKRYESATDRQKRDALLTGLPLEEGADLVHRWGLPTTVPLAAFVAVSVSRRKVVRRRGYAVAAALVLIFAGIATAAGLQWRVATEQRKLAFLSQERAELEARRTAAEAIKADQRAGQLATNVALSLIGEGAIDPALLMLLRASQAFNEFNAPDELLIAFNRALEESARSSRIQLDAKVVVFDTAPSLILFDRSSGNLSTFGAQQPFYRGSSKDAAVTAVALTPKSKRILVARTTSDIELIDTATGYREMIGDLPLPAGAQPQDSELRLTDLGLAYRKTSVRSSDGTARLRLQILDAFSSKKIDQIVEISIPKIGRGRNGRLYVTDGSNAFEIANGILTAADLNDEAQQQILYGSCIEGASQAAGTATLKWLTENANVGADWRCSQSDNSILLTMVNSTSAGPDRSDVVVDENGKISDVRDMIRAASPEKLSGNNFSWVGLSLKSGWVGSLLSRSLILTDQNGNLLSTFHHISQPTAAAFLDKLRIAVVEPDRHEIVIHNLQKRTPPSSRLLDEKESDDESAANNLFELLNKGTCVGYSSPQPTEAKMADGSKIVFSTSSITLSSELHQFEVIGGKLAKLVKLDGTDKCIQLSKDGRRFLLAGSGDVSIYSTSAAMQTESLAHAKVASLHLPSVMSAFFLTSEQILTADYSNRVLLWKASASGEWVSEEVYRGDFPVIYAEPDANGKRLIVLQDVGQGEVKGFVYSISAKQNWFDLGEEYKWLGAAFTAAGEVVTSHGRKWTSLNRFMSLTELSAAAKKALSPSCEPPLAEAYEASPCWPKTLN